MRIREWSPSGHMLSVIVPVNCRFACAEGKAAMMSRANIRGFTAALLVSNYFLATWSHEMGSRTAGIHDPHAALAAVLRQTHGLCRCARHGDGHVLTRVFRVGAAHM